MLIESLPLGANACGSRCGRGRSGDMTAIFKTLALFVLTAVAEILGSYLPYLCLRRHQSSWLLLPASASLGVSRGS
jgi:Uncharacterised BCR, YnfA/UPF0060 family